MIGNIIAMVGGLGLIVLGHVVACGARCNAKVPDDERTLAYFLAIVFGGGGLFVFGLGMRWL